MIHMILSILIFNYLGPGVRGLEPALIFRTVVAWNAFKSAR